MATYAEYQPYVDYYFNQLGAEAKAMLDMGTNPQLNDDEYNQFRVKMGEVLAKKFGLKPEAGERLFTIMSAYKSNEKANGDPTKQMNILWAVDATKLGPRASYNTQAEYDDAVMKAGGLPSKAEIAELMAANQKADDDANGRYNTIQKLKVFAAGMLGDVAPNDPIMTQLVQAGADASQAAAGAAGISGRSGLAGTQAASLGQVNAAPYLTQRASLGASALSAAGNLELGNEQLNAAYAQSLQDRADMIAAETWRGETGQMQTALGLGGGILGGIIGGIATESPQGAMQGFKIGSDLGAGTATLASPATPNYQTVKRPKARGSSGRGEGF